MLFIEHVLVVLEHGSISVFELCKLELLDCLASWKLIVIVMSGFHWTLLSCYYIVVSPMYLCIHILYMLLSVIDSRNFVSHTAT